MLLTGSVIVATCLKYLLYNVTITGFPGEGAASVFIEIIVYH